MKIQFIGVLLLLSGIILSCSKTNYEQEERPYTDILKFSIDRQQDKDNLLAIVSADSIIVYWNPDVAQPDDITPHIEVSTGATISPASGATVPFSEQTVYTVTAENGQTRQYFLKIKTKGEVPVLSAIVGSNRTVTPMEQITWRVAGEDPIHSGIYLYLLGEYFLATNNIEDIKVYAQRLHDGYEFDLPVHAETATNTSLQVELPRFSNQLDSGVHRIWVQVGDLVTDSKDLFFKQPDLNTNGNGRVEVQLLQSPGGVYAGQTATIKYNYSDDVEGAVTRYYSKNHLHQIMVNMRVLERIDTTINERTGRELYREVYNNGSFLLDEFTVSDTEVHFKLPEEVRAYVGGTLQNIQLLYKYINKEGIWTHLSDNTATTYGKVIRLGNAELIHRDPVTGIREPTPILAAP